MATLPSNGPFGNSWEVDWDHPLNTGQKIMARNPRSKQQRAREWHFVTRGQLREQGVATPQFSITTWEVDWSKRTSKSVWARNPKSKMPRAREWHFVSQGAFNRVGIPWKPKNPPGSGRYLTKDGYWQLSIGSLSPEDAAIVRASNLYSRKDQHAVKEHRLVAFKKYGCLPPGTVVRHMNGIKTDNRPENLVLGTTQENTLDHDSARRAAMFWREQCHVLFLLLLKKEAGL